VLQSSASRAATFEEATFLYQPLAGDGEVVAQVVSMSGGGLEGAAGVSVRTSLTPGAPVVTLWLTRSGRLNLDSRQQAGGSITRRISTPLRSLVWVKLERRGTQVSAFQSPDGRQWTAVGSATLPVAASLFVGVVAGSQDGTTRLDATLSDVRSAPFPTLPAGWSAADIGGALSGTSSYSNGTFAAVVGATTTASQFRFINTRVSGDVELVARVVAGGAATKAEAGVTVRGSLAADAATIALAISRSNTRLIKRRVDAGLPLVETSGATRAAPWWLKVVRRGTLVTTFESANGSTWTPVSSDAVILPASFYVGLSVAAGSTASGQATFDQVAVRAIAANRWPAVTVTAPLSVSPGASVVLSASATDPDGSVAAVEFYVDGLLLGVDTAAPYQASWPNVSVGSHVITAIAVDSDGARAPSAPATVVAASSTTAPPPSTTSPPPTSTTTPPPSTTPPPVVSPPPVVPSLPPVSRRLVFSPSLDHDSTVDRYRLDVYASSPRQLVFSLDLGKPAVVSGDCTVDISPQVSALAAGLYEAVVRAVDDGTGRSSLGAFVAFTR